MAKQRKHCEASIARVYSEYLRAYKPIHPPRPISLDTCCIVSKKSIPYDDTNFRVSTLLTRLTRREYNGHEVNVRLWTVHKRAQVCGVQFTSGQPMTGLKSVNEKMLRCGSVITLVRGVRSLYAWVIRFLSFDRIHVAHVKWLPEPEYPTGTPVFVRVKRGLPPPNETCIVPLIDIEPSQVAILQEDTYLYMMRSTGINTMPPE